MAKNVMQAPTSEGKEYGLADVKVGKSAAKITFKKGGTTYKISREDLPKRPKLEEGYEGELMVILNGDKDAVDAFVPKEGRYKAHCIDFVRPAEDEDPEPKLVTKGEGKDKHTYQTFTALWEIIDGKYKGCVVRQFLRYRFKENPDGNAMFDGNPDNPNARHVPYLKEFLEKTDCVDEEIKWPEDGNILPELLRRILKKDKQVELIFKDGFISSLLEIDYEDEDEEKPQKSSKKSSKKDEKEEEEDEDDDL